MSQFPIVLAITGASGLVYGQRLLQVLLESQLEVHLTISDSARVVAEHELNLTLDLQKFEIDQLLPGHVSGGKLTYHHYKDFMTPIASGSFKTRGMIVCPCSGGTMSGIATAASRNLIQRAADVHLKENRRLVLVPREAPLSLIKLTTCERPVQRGRLFASSARVLSGNRSGLGFGRFCSCSYFGPFDIEHNLVGRWV